MWNAVPLMTMKGELVSRREIGHLGAVWEGVPQVTGEGGWHGRGRTDAGGNGGQGR